MTLNVRSHLAAAPRNGANRVNLEMRCYHVARVEKEPHSFFYFQHATSVSSKKKKKAMSKSHCSMRGISLKRWKLRYRSITSRRTQTTRDGERQKSETCALERRWYGQCGSSFQSIRLQRPESSRWVCHLFRVCIVIYIQAHLQEQSNMVLGNLMRFVCTWLSFPYACFLRRS